MQQMAQQPWAGQSRQTAVPEAGAGWHSRHFSTSINQHAQAEEGEGRGRWRVGSHYPPTHSHPTQDWPLLGPIGTSAICWAEKGYYPGPLVPEGDATALLRHGTAWVLC